MDHGTKYWFAQTYEKQCEDIHFELYSLFHYCHELNDHNVKVHMNRCIKYTQFSIDDPKNNEKVPELNNILELERLFKENYHNIQIAEQIDDFFCTSNVRKIFKSQKQNTQSLYDIAANLFDMITANTPQIRLSIVQYDENDTPIKTYTGTFSEIFDSINNPSDSYYRIAAFNQNTPRGRISNQWFGIKTSCLGGLSFNIEETLNRFLNYMVKRYEKGVIGNFYHVLSHYLWYSNAIAKSQTISPVKLQEQLTMLKKKYPELKEVNNLNDYRKKTGIYILVLDKYNVFYIGQADDITQRIMRHWSRSDYYNGVGIDLFKAYDTTRILVLECESKKKNSIEYKMIELADPDTSLNVLSGGEIDYIMNNNLPLLKNSNDQGIDDLIQDFYTEQDAIVKIESYFIVDNSNP